MMILLMLHSGWRWVVVLTLFGAIIRSGRGLATGRPFTPFDNALRHWTATLAHIQLVLGILLFVNNPVATSFRIIHMTGMFTAITVLTIGSAMAKRRTGPREKFATMFWWFLAAAMIILLLIPWPFSPLAQRPLIRTF